MKIVCATMFTAVSMAAMAKIQVTPPVLADKPYTGERQTATIPDSEYWTVMPYSGWTAAGTYSVSLVLNNSDACEWSAAAGVTVDEELAIIPFKITQAANEWTVAPAIKGWKWGEAASQPVAEAKFGEVTLVYNGTTTGGQSVSDASSITASGTYTAVFTVPGSSNYSGLSESVDFTVALGEISGGGGSGGGSVSLTAEGYEGVYDANPHSVNVAVSGVAGETFSITYSTEEYGAYSATKPSFTDAGAYTVWYKIDSASYAEYKGSLSVQISKAKVTPPALASKTYTGSRQTADVPGSGLYGVVANLGGTPAGSYDVFLQLADKGNYEWAAADGVTVDDDIATVQFTITQAANEWTTEPSMTGWEWGKAASTPVAASKFGHPPTVTYSGTTAGGTAVTGATSITAPGEYEANFTVVETTDYAGLSMSVPFTVTLGQINIDPNDPSEPKLVVQGYDGVYDGAEHSISVQIVGADAEQFTIGYAMDEMGPFAGENPKFADACFETVWYCITSPNFAALTNSAAVRIAKVGVASPIVAAKTFNGTPQTADVPDSNLYMIKRNKGGTMAGTYAVVLALADSANYKWTDSEDDDLILPFQIVRAENSWIAGPSAPTEVIGDGAGFPVATAKYGDVEVRYSGTDADGGTVSDALQIVKAGSYTAHFMVRETSSWGGLSASIPLTVAESGSVTAGTPKLLGTSAMVSVNRSLAIPRSWFGQYEGFVGKFGTDLAKAATMPTGKVDGNGKTLQVWHDYVAGTDPTDEDSKLSVSIELRDGKPKVTWTPDKNGGGAKAGARVYTVWGKKALTDKDWTPNVDETSGEWKFFKVTVDMPE